ncbi:hypothetical protein SFMTTN_2081 [Sulfuriferula multivorans]|uniref:Uncharacterized protein n=1 Tax=Sulfuriferula multivorans TaxID=1559896 RepID=A0A401JF88_9PROT|nr:hypothetical protein [Sulfuriferula multivorans]GBL46268.1 hypothetical protein SFMTTN_2081 [Sulfuriferula multivorans]
MSIAATFDFLRRAAQTATIRTGRGFADFLTSRIVQATTEPSLLAAMERLLKSLGSDISYIGGEKMARFMAAAGGVEAPGLLSWLRAYPNMAAMIALLRNDDDYAAALASIQLPAAQVGDRGSAPPSRPWQIGISAICTSPLAHGADGKAGNATLFRRQQVLSTTGQVLDLPFYAGNAVRGQLRDILADHFIGALGLTVSRVRPPLALWFFHALYAGGVLEEGGGDAIKAVGNELGNNGTLRTEGVHRLRDHLPALSLLGVALGNRVLPGRLYAGDLRPRCREWGNGAIDAAELMEWTFLTRREDHEDHADNHSMIANTECLRTGTVLEGGIDLDTHAGDLERSALGCGLALLQQRGLLGAENRRGLGRVDMAISGAPDPALYLDWLAAEKPRILDYLAGIHATDTSGNDAILGAQRAAKSKPKGKPAKAAVAPEPFQDDSLAGL